MPAPRPALCRSRRTGARASGVMRSPETAMGMAGGQPTVGRPQTPSQGVGRRSRFPGEQRQPGGWSRRAPHGPGAAGGDSPPRGTAPGPRAAWANSSGVFSGVAISTRKSRSAYSHILRPGAAAARPALGPVTPAGSGPTVTRKGSLGSTRQACGGEPFPKLRQAFDGPPPGAGGSPPPGSGCTNPKRPASNKKGWWSQTAPGADLASGASCAGAVGERCRYAPPVSTGRVLWAESQHKSAPQIHGVEGGLQKPQIGPVGVVHQQQGAVLVAHLGQSGDFRHAAQIVRAGEVYRRRRLRQAV